MSLLRHPRAAPHIAIHHIPYVRPTAAKVAEIVDNYGIQAAIERWSESMSAPTIKILATEGRKAGRT